MTASILDNATTPDRFSIDLDKPSLVKIDHLACYQIDGEDAAQFLQGQFSNDINAISPATGQLSSYSTPKGRMLAIFYICKRGDEFLLIISKDIAEAIMERLQMYIMRSKVSIKALDETSLIGLCNDASGEILNSLKLEVPKDEYQVSTSNALVCMNIPGISPRYLIIGDETLHKEITSLDTNNINVYSNTYWQWLDIMAGIPNITINTQEAFVPQMANMELIEGVSFSKGCYPGQEIVARLHYLGNTNRRMFRIEVEQDEPINIGDDIYTQDSDQPIGKFMSVITEAGKKYSGLAVLRIEAVKQNQLAIGSPSGNSAQIMPLPYDVPIELKEK